MGPLTAREELLCDQHNCCTKLYPVAGSSRLIVIGSILGLNGLQTSLDNQIEEFQVKKAKCKQQTNTSKSIFIPHYFIRKYVTALSGEDQISIKDTVSLDIVL